jgi:hypothetical protein
MGITLFIGNQAVYAGPVMNDVWVFYGEVPVAGVGGGSVDAYGNPSMVAPCPPTGTANSCMTGVPNISSTVPNIGHSNLFNNLDDTAPQIRISCYDDSEDPTAGGFSGFDFTNAGPITQDDCGQNTRNAADIGVAVKGLTGVTAQNPDEIQFDEMVVMDIGALITAGYTNPMIVLSSHSSGHVAWMAVSDKCPLDDAGMPQVVSNNDLTLVPNTITGNDGVFLGSAPGTNFNDNYFSIPLKRCIYHQEISNSGDDDKDHIVQQFKAEVPVIGGTGMQIDATSMLLAGAQTSAYWILPIVVSGIVIGIITIRRK